MGGPPTSSSSDHLFPNSDSPHQVSSSGALSSGVETCKMQRKGGIMNCSPSNSAHHYRRKNYHSSSSSQDDLLNHSHHPQHHNHPPPTNRNCKTNCNRSISSKYSSSSSNKPRRFTKCITWRGGGGWGRGNSFITTMVTTTFLLLSLCVSHTVSGKKTKQIEYFA